MIRSLQNQVQDRMNLFQCQVGFVPSESGIRVQSCMGFSCFADNIKETGGFLVIL